MMAVSGRTPPTNPVTVGSLPAVWAAELQTWCSQVVRRYRVRMWHSVESAVSSTDAAGMLHTAIPVGAGSRVRSEGDPADRVYRCWEQDELQPDFSGKSSLVWRFVCCSVFLFLFILLQAFLVILVYF